MKIFEARLDLVPELPGVYLMKDEAGNIIYVGKAINLRKRLASYFQKTNKANYRISIMVKKIADFDFVICANELEALVLESGFIKSYQPFYNVLLKDDKDYPYLELDFSNTKPSLNKVYRKEKKENVFYFGPYQMADILELKLALEEIFELKSCSNFFKEEKAKKPRACLKYHIGTCIGTCIGLVSVEEYHHRLRQAKLVLEGKTREVASKIKETMLEAAKEENYQEAAKKQRQLKALDAILAKQRVVSNQSYQADVFGLAIDDNTKLACLKILHIRDGRIIFSSSYFVTQVENCQEALKAFFRDRYLACPDDETMAKDIIISDSLSIDKDVESLLTDKAFKISSFKKGEKRELVLMAEQSARESLLRKINKESKLKAKERELMLGLKALQKVLKLDKLPRRIEFFDISNQGDDIVASMVCFVDGKKYKPGYRRYTIRSIKEQDDYAGMREAVARRLLYLDDKKREKRDEELEILPDLILLDGGKSHLNSVLNMAWDERNCHLPFGIKFAAVVKNNKHKTRGIVDSDFKVHELLLAVLNRTNAYVKMLTWLEIRALLSLLTSIQNEGHKFAVSFLQQKLHKKALTYRLEEIRGIGPKRRRELLQIFGSIRAIEEADFEEILAKTGFSEELCQNIYDYFHMSEKS